MRKVIALPTFSADAISSTAYATEEILVVIAAGSSSLALGVAKLVPISLVVAGLLVVVVTSYRQTLFAYPNGGGSYIVSRENLGRYPSLVAAAALLIDYVLTVAVSISAGVAAIVSLPSLQNLASDRVTLCLLAIAAITVANLRGMKQSGALFAAPTYTYIALMVTLVGYGLFRTYVGHIHPIPFDPKAFEGARQMGGTLGLFLLLKGFSSGAIALTGVEAISNGVPAFQPPRIQERGHHDGLDGHHPREPVLRRLPPRQSPSPVPEPQPDRDLRTGAGGSGHRPRLRRAPGGHRRHLDPGRQHRLCRLPPIELDHRPRRLRSPPVGPPRRSVGVLQRHPHPRRPSPPRRSWCSGARPTPWSRSTR